MLKMSLAAALLMAAIPTAVAAQQEVVPFPDKPTQATPGKIPPKQVFTEYCAACHGASGKGDGPAAVALKRKPADLTRLAVQNNGKFPDMRVIQVIKSGADIPAHGSAVMPVWGPIFMNEGKAATQNEMQLFIYNLAEYIKTLQVK